MLAIVGGRGLSALDNLQVTHRQVMRTPYGLPSGALTFGILNGKEVVFLARHGYGHTLAPHEINYRANIWALKEVGATRIASVSAVGGISAAAFPGRFVIPHQLIDYTHGRKSTYFEGAQVPLVLMDFTEPYCPIMRRRLLRAGLHIGLDIMTEAVYAVTQGPRLDTSAEVKRLAQDGADIVGMTGMPEAALAKELDLSYAALAVVGNWAAGIQTSQKSIDLDTANQQLRVCMEQVREMLAFLVLQDDLIEEGY